MAKKITLKNKNGDVLCPHTAIEQVQGLKEALDTKLGKTEKAVSAKTTKVSKASEADPNFALSFYAGEAEASTTPTADKVYVGSRTDGSIISVPKLDGSTSMANYMNLRMSFNSRYFHEIAVLPNNDGIYHRNVRNGNALEWKQLLEGLVTTSKIADTAITPAKIQTSIALNGTPSMTVEPTTSSPDKTIASVGLVKEAVENIEIGGVNLILNSDFSSGTEHWAKNSSSLLVSFSVEDKVATFSLESSSADVLKASSIRFEVGQEYTVSFDCRSDEYTALDYCYFIGQEGQGNKSFYIYGITSEWKRIIYTFTSEISGLYRFGFGANRNRNTAGSFQLRNVKIEKGNKATDWSPAPEDIEANISNAETRSKAHAEDYTNAEIDKIENGDIVAQKANSLYDDDSGTYKDWGEIDSAITREIGNKFEGYATKSYVQEQISNQVAVPIASETEDGKVKLATPEDVTAVENDNSAVNDSAKAVTPYTLKEYIASKNFATSSDISSAVTAAKPTIFFQAAQPAGGKDGDIWIIP